MRPSPYLAGTPCRNDRPPTHFFVKKKFRSIGGAAPASQKVSSVFCYAHAFCGEGAWVGRSESPSQGLPPGGGGRVPMGAEIPPSAYTDWKHYLKSVQKPRAAQEVPRTQEGGSLYRLNPQPLPPLKKPLKIMGIQGESLPDAPLAAHLRIRRSRIPRCVVKRRTAEPRDSVLRPCPSEHAESGASKKSGRGAAAGPGGCTARREPRSPP